LTEKETSILRYLYRAGQRPVSRETLLQEVWAYNSGVTTHTTILGLESGANDYVTKPFRFAVLPAQVRTLLRQYETSEDAVFTIGPYSNSAGELEPVFQTSRIPCHFA
jgi:DNA-binding response OmpR family regulator